MNILDKYILKTYLSTFVFIIGMVIFIVVAVDYNEKAADFSKDDGPTTVEILVDYYLNFIPFYANLLSPICLFLAVVYFTSKMAERTEIIPMLSSGISFYRILAPYFVGAIILSLSFFYLRSYVTPHAMEQQLEFEYKYLRKKRISRSTNITKKVAEDTYVFIGHFDEKRNSGSNFMLHRKKGGDFDTRIKADRMLWVDSTESWTLIKVEIREFSKNKESIRFLPEMDTTFLLSPDDIFIKEQLAESMTLPVLARFIELEEMRGSDILEDLYANYYRRFADPFAMVILTLIGFAIATKKARGGIAVQIVLGLVISFSYIALMFTGRVILGAEADPRLVVWLPNLIFAPIAVVLLVLAKK